MGLRSLKLLFAAVALLTFHGNAETIRVGTFDFFPGVFRNEETGEIQGLFLDLLQDVAEQENWTLDVVHGSWSECLDRIRSGDIDLLTSVVHTEERTEFMTYCSEPLLVTWGGVYVSEGSSIDTLFELRGKRIAIMKGDYNADLFQKHIRAFNIPCDYLELDSYPEMLSAVRDGNADAAALNSLPGAALCNRFHTKGTGIVFNPFEIFFTASKQCDPTVITRLNHYLADWKNDPDSIYYQRMDHWMHNDINVRLITPKGVRDSLLILSLLLLGMALLILFMRRTIQRRTRQLAEQNTVLQESEARYRTIFDAPTEAIFVHDAQTGKILDVNQSMLTMFGFVRKEDALTTTASDLSMTSDEFTMEQALRRIRDAAAGEPQQFEWISKRKDGSCFPTEVSLMPMRLQNRNCVLAIVRDITQLKKEEEEHAKIQQQLTQAQRMESVGRLAGGIAHDFNNQLQGILGFAELIDQTTDEKQTHSNATSIIMLANRSAVLIRQLLAYARTAPYLPQSVNLHHIIDEVSGILKRTIDKRIEIHTRLQANPPCTRGDASLLQNALLNLALNARDAMPDGGTLTFETENTILHAETDSNPSPGISIRVHDTGHGIPLDQQDKIFEPFFTTKEVGKGTGMGLAAVYGTITHHEGSIDVRSEPGRGTTFHIRLPQVACEEPWFQTAEPCPGIPEQQATILVIDDEPAVRMVTECFAREMGHRCTSFENAPDALEHLRSHPANLIILDMIMPKMNGEEAFHAIQAIQPNASVLLASGFSKDDTVERLLEAGALGFIQKPYQKADFTAIISSALHA